MPTSDLVRILMAVSAKRELTAPGRRPLNYPFDENAKSVRSLPISVFHSIPFGDPVQEARM